MVRKHDDFWILIGNLPLYVAKGKRLLFYRLSEGDQLPPGLVVHVDRYPDDSAVVLILSDMERPTETALTGVTL